MSSLNNQIQMCFSQGLTQTAALGSFHAVLTCEAITMIWLGSSVVM